MLKTIAKIMLGFVLLIVVGVPVLVGTLYFRNDYVGVETDFSASVHLIESPAPFTEPVTLKVVTFNIQDLYIVGRNRPARMRHIGRVLTALDPDIVGFQESFIDKDREILIAALEGTRLRHHQYYPSGVGGSGLLISSAWPIREAYFHRYTVSGPARRIWEGDFWGGKGVALARIETPAGMLDFYNTHAQAGYGRAEYREVRRIQMEELAAFVNQSKTGTSPAFLVGDMNCRIGAVVENAIYEFDTLDTVRIEERITEGGRTFRLSDHAGFMSTVRIAPVDAANTGILP